MRRAHALLGGAVLSVTLAACGANAPQGQLTEQGPLRTGSEALAQIFEQRGAILTGGRQAFEARLAALDGYPVVVNQWASWCGPCRLEFPLFARAAQRLRGTVAFLGVNSQDSVAAAGEFLRESPVPFPHFTDPDSKIARLFRGGRAWPTTAFYDAGGRLTFTHVGQYRDAAALDADIRAYTRSP